VHLADLVDHSGVEKDALGQRGFSGIDVSGDADVAGRARAGTAVRCNSDLLTSSDCVFSLRSVNRPKEREGCRHGPLIRDQREGGKSTIGRRTQ